MKSFYTSIYSIEIPENWEVQNNDRVISIFNPEGAGSITLSTYSNSEKTQNAKDVLEKLVKGRGAIQTEKISQTEKAEAEYLNAEEENSYYTYAVAVCKEITLVLVTYNCKKDLISSNELDTAKQIINSLKIN